MPWINSYVSNSRRMLIWKINKLISSEGMHGWRVGAVVYRQGLCCTFGWTRKSPWQPHWRRAWWSRWLPSYSLLSCLPDRQRYRCDKMSKLDEGPVPGAPPLLAPQSLSIILFYFQRLLPLMLSYFAFASFLSVPSPLAYLKPKISWLHSQARWGEVDCSQGKSWHIC